MVDMGIGSSMAVKAVQPLNAFAPMLVTEFPIVTEANVVQPWKAPSPMVVTELGIVTDVIFFPKL